MHALSVVFTRSLCVRFLVVLCVCVLFFLSIRRPPRSTRTDTLFPYTTRFRSCGAGLLCEPLARLGAHGFRNGPATIQIRVAPPYAPIVCGDRKSTRLNSSH